MEKQAVEILTPGGRIQAGLVADSDYPAIQIEINGELAAVVEYDSLAETFKIRTYQGDDDEPYTNVDYVEPTKEM